MKLTQSEEFRYINIEDKDRLIDFLKFELQLDFSKYSEASVRRRFAKVLREFRLPDAESFIHFMKQQEQPRELFLEKFTVNVTEMFRDPYCYQSLVESVFPLLADKDDIKIWSAGCSTGEEVLSLSILLREHGIIDKCRIIATDVSDSVLNKARSATYPAIQVKQSHAAYLHTGGTGSLQDYYSIKKDMAIFEPELLRQVEYQSHNLTEDPPEADFDMIICRNVLIYFNSLLQDEVIGKFDRNLKPGGILMIGSKESIIFYGSSHHFQELVKDRRIYQKRN